MVNEASGTVAVTAGAGTAWAFASQTVEVVFGLPVQVVLACFFASAAARTYVGSVGLLKTAWIIVMCAMIGAYSIPLVLHLLGLPTTVQAGVGVLISGGIQIPALRDWLVETVKAIVQRRVGSAPTVPLAPPPVAPLPPTPPTKEIK